ncbi:MAG: hypothetical protein JXR66_10060 [Bacteroidales bacterium]|nr:hypothetical protein [Bacteroidales bacterium]MBN2633890.1 hypothetical protein [Bacteroidales bacterium]
MNRSEKKLRELSAILKGDDTKRIEEAVSQLREEEPYEGAIVLLASYYDDCNDRALMKLIGNFFNDIKDQSARSEVMAEIRKARNPATTSMLVASCWQSGLDYSAYIEDIARIFLEADYATAIECMTVIEESVEKSSRNVKDKVIELIMDSPHAFMHEKNPLTLELLAMLRN